ncbi:hypothetical protein SADUNF_Sadunf05G0195500 [Salix dunnii]|uniref:Uncharacterized protein n=1 Tax=Salix dunnii TaxID=1413687 RepID=A0A835MZV7_9ROSI|nr:hypothetical protein SADUNF_Sadunf05G0195500 [Salix dunnii]
MALFYKVQRIFPHEFARILIMVDSNSMVLETSFQSIRKMLDFVVSFPVVVSTEIPGDHSKHELVPLLCTDKNNSAVHGRMHDVLDNAVVTTWGYHCDVFKQ